MDFNDLKRAWNHCDRELDTAIRLNAHRLRSVLARNAEPGANELSPNEVDYTVPVVLVQKQLDSNWIVRIAQAAAAWIHQACRADEIDGRLQPTVMRLLRRHRTLRG
jgi:hypothetical protein